MTTTRIQYCLGFAFSSDLRRVLLIRKVKPAWQQGRLNGIGGKLEPGETAVEAMTREFGEESGIITEAKDWHLFCEMIGKDWNVLCFSMVSGYAIDGAQSVTREKVAVISCLDLAIQPVVPNLRWLIPLALDTDRPFTTSCY